MSLSEITIYFSEIWWVLTFAITILVVIFAVKTESRVSENQISQESLTRNEKISVWLFSFLDPLVAGAVFYYWWRKKLPMKAKQANKISWLAILILIVLYWGLVYFFGYWLPIL